MERHGMPDYQPEQQAAERGNNNDEGARRHLFLGAGRVLMLWGWGELTVASAAGPKNGDDDGRPEPVTCSAVHALLGFVLWILGVSLVALVHVERRFPRAARAGAAVANAVVVDRVFVRRRPWNN